MITGSTKRLFEEFKTIGIQCQEIKGQKNLIRHQTINGDWLYLKSMVSEKLPLFSYQIASDKWWSYEFMNSLNIPTPMTRLYETDAKAMKFIDKYKPIVIKPQSGAHSNGITMNISDSNRLAEAVGRANVFNKSVLLQEQADGADIRLLIIGGKLISAVERIPAAVIADGHSSVWQLIKTENSQNPSRGVVGVDKLVKISETAAQNYLSKDELNSVPKKGRLVRVVGPSNHSIGGMVRDAMQVLDKIVISQAELLTKQLKMPLAGVDCILTKSGCKFIEINASPGIGIHDDNLIGIKSGCFNTYAKLLYAQDIITQT